VVLVSALFGAAGAGILVLAPLLGEDTPGGLDGARPWLLGLVGLAVVLLGAEWLGIH
jgi:hypothetical protein